ncbi:MAG: LysR substrate-binding domain-containing protein [Thiolinea sp.]
MDRIDMMKAFITVVTEGSFIKAAERLDCSPQLVSKYVAQLESHLGSRLLNRTTRRLSVTEAGTIYFQRARQVLADIDEMEHELGDLQHAARGRLRINAPVSFAIHHLSRPLVKFQQDNPKVSIDLQLNDRAIDIVEEGFDIALRIGRLKSSSLIAKYITPIRLVTCAAPSYLQQHGIPSHPDELKNHRFLHYSYMEDTPEFKQQAIDFSANNGDVLVQAATEGAGIVIQPTFIAGRAIAGQKLQLILQDYEPEPMALYAVYAHRQLLSGKVRSFVDFIAGYFTDTPYWDDF